MRQATRRLLAYGSNASIVTVAVIIAVSLGYMLADSYRSRIDFSEEAQNTLQPDTLSKLRLLDGDGEVVTITAFSAQAGTDDAYFKNREVKDLIREVDHNSQVVSWNFVDFDRERFTAERLGVSDYGRIVIQRGDDRVDIRSRDLFRRAGRGQARQLEFIGEAALSRGFAQLMTDSRQVVYVLQNHGELQLQDIGPDGLSSLAGALDQERYDVDSIDLLSSTREGEIPQVPDDAAVVFVPRPKGTLTAQEEDILLSYLGRGGSLLFAVDVGTPVADLVRRLGVIVPDGIAMDSKVIAPYRDRPVPAYAQHEITAEVSESGLISMLGAPAPLLIPEEPPAGVQFFPLLSTSRRGWIERGGPAAENGNAEYQPAIDGAGPAIMAAAAVVYPGQGLVRSSRPAARVVVVGDSEMFTNALLAEGPGNQLLATNMIHWLAGEDRRLEVGVGRTAKVRRLAITQEEMASLRLLSLGLMPSLVFLAGLITWRSRRGR
jgi:hypothetical protein